MYSGIVNFFRFQVYSVLTRGLLSLPWKSKSIYLHPNMHLQLCQNFFDNYFESDSNAVRIDLFESSWPHSAERRKQLQGEIFLLTLQQQYMCRIIKVQTCHGPYLKYGMKLCNDNFFLCISLLKWLTFYFAWENQFSCIMRRSLIYMMILRFINKHFNLNFIFFLIQFEDTDFLFIIHWINLLSDSKNKTRKLLWIPIKYSDKTCLPFDARFR